MMFITLSNHGEDELVQLKDEQSDWCWVDVPTQAAPDLRPARAMQLVAHRHAILRRTSGFTFNLEDLNKKKILKSLIFIFTLSG